LFHIMSTTVKVCANKQEISQQLAEIVVDLSKKAIADKGKFTIGLSGGT